MSLFGPIVTGATVEQAVEDHLRLWMPAYLAVAERQTGRPARSIPHPKAWKRENQDVRKWPSDKVPAIVIVSPGLAGKPTKEGDGTYTCVYGTAIAVMVNARDQQAANDLVKLYSACVTLILLQHPGLGNNVSVLSWEDESWAETDSSYLKIGAVAKLAFEIGVRGVLNASGGPTEPPDDPYEDAGDWPTVATTDLTLTAEAIT